jgi:hypothetical protein
MPMRTSIWSNRHVERGRACCPDRRSSNPRAKGQTASGILGAGRKGDPIRKISGRMIGLGGRMQVSGRLPAIGRGQARKWPGDGICEVLLGRAGQGKSAGPSLFCFQDWTPCPKRRFPAHRLPPSARADHRGGRGRARAVGQARGGRRGRARAAADRGLDDSKKLTARRRACSKPRSRTAATGRSAWWTLKRSTGSTSSARRCWP